MRNIILLSLILFIMASCSSIQNNGNEKFILPENYEGSVIVLYDYDEKELLKKEWKDNGYIVYEIPPSGIYYTKNELAKGLINHKYYRKNGGFNEEIRRINFPLLEDESIDLDSIYVMDLRPGEFSKRPIGSEKHSSDFGKVKYISFIVGKYNNREKLLNIEREKLDSLIIRYLENLSK